MSDKQVTDLEIHTAHVEAEFSSATLAALAKLQQEHIRKLLEEGFAKRMEKVAVSPKAPDYKHVMIDLETLGLTPNSVILSIGAVAFNPTGAWEPISPFKRKISISSSLLAGMDIHKGTVEWWKTQPAELRDTTFTDDGVRLAWALGDFSIWFREKQLQYVWGNGSDFDIALLKRAYDLCGLPIPWSYKDVRCHRTVNGLHGIPADYVKPTKAHDPVEDAIAQVKTLGNITKRIGAEWK